MTPDQLLIVALISSGLTVLLKFVANNFGYQPGKATLTLFVAVVSGLIAVLFNIPMLPEYIDPLQYLGEWFDLLSIYVGAATIIYNMIIDKVLDRFNLVTERFYKPKND